MHSLVKSIRVTFSGFSNSAVSAYDVTAIYVFVSLSTHSNHAQNFHWKIIVIR